MSQSAPIFSPVIRPVGIETEFGVLQPGDPYANAVAMASRVVEALRRGFASWSHGTGWFPGAGSALGL